MSSSRRPFALIALAALALVSLFSTAMAAEDAIPLDHKGLPQWEIKVWNDAPVRLELRDREAVQEMLDRVPLASFHREDLTIVWDTPKMFHLLIDVRATEAEVEALIAAGYRPERLPDLDRAGREEAERIWAEMAAAKSSPVKADPYDYYPNNTQIATILDDIATTYPTLARRFQWGTSVQGRELWGIVISQDVTNHEAEPEVRISSTMHGDEVVPMVNALNLAHYLTDNYGVAGFEDVTYLVDNYEIHLMPLYNPDGNVLTQRGNANGVDLNRNFPLPDPGHATQETETLHFMDHGNANHFVISQNGHGGALVVNYPWDYTYTLAPDNDALIELSLEYSTYNLPMYNSPIFSQGITNGAAWYVTQGCLQDWSYDQTDCIDVTLEQSDDKWPSASTLPGFWDDNRESYMHWIKAARYGVNGVVTASDSGLPLDATITVTGNAMPVHTDPRFGDYYKLLDTGTYELTFTAYGYIDQTISGVATIWGTPTVLNVAMNPVAHGDITGYVYETGGTPIDAQIDAYTHPDNEYIAVVSSSATLGGAYTVPNLVYGDYRLVYSAAGHITGQQIVTLDGSTVAAPDITLGIAEEVTLLGDDFESGSGQWTGDWGLDAPGYGGVGQDMSDSPGDHYPNYAATTCEIASPLDLSDIMSGSVSYRCKWDIEPNWDGVQFQVSIDGGSNWTPLASSRTGSGSGQGAQNSGEPYYEGAQANWVLETRDLAPWLGESDVRFRFLLVSDSSVYEDGFHFDDFLAEGLRESDPGTGIDTPLLATRLQGAYPNPFNPTTKIAFTSARAGHVTLEIYDVTGRLMRTLVDGHVGAGEHATLWDGRGDDGTRAASGVYFARFAGGEVVDTTKLMLVK
ncbi:T9SS type A sorting domain-containing protein [bacterium]|nr:T9SS type A sorting domain-containing protein [bacterium]